MKMILLSLATYCAAVGTGLSDDEIKGRITAIDPPNASFEISGVRVDAAAARVKTLGLIPAKFGDLRIGNLVEVEGKFTGAGRIRAKEVKRDLGRYGEIKGAIESIDAEGKEFTISGITVRIQERKRMRDMPYRILSRGPLSAGRRVSCEGRWTGNMEFSAHRVFAW